jgi:hypothetical protein
VERAVDTGPTYSGWAGGAHLRAQPVAGTPFW